jgi:predicted Zn-dependent protease
MDNTERVSRYLSGLMEAEERRAFEADAAADPALAEELSLQREMAAFLRGREQREARRRQLRALGQEYFTPAASGGRLALSRLRRWWPALAAAAAIAGLILAWPYLFSPSLYEQYARHPPLALSEKSTDDPMDWSAAETAFNTGDYAAAAAILERYLAQRPEDELARLYLGIALLELDRFEEARRFFLSLADAEAALKDHADWYLALSYLKANDQARCRVLLRAIAPTSSLYGRAAELLKKLD